MHCIYCGAVLQSGMRACLSCGAAAPAETFNSSPYDTDADALPYIPYTPIMAGTTSTSTPEAYSPQGAEVARPSFPVQRIQRRGLAKRTITLLVMLSLVVIAGGGGLIYYATAIRPGQLHTQAIATAQSQATAQVQANTPQGIYSKATSGITIVNDPLNNSATSSWNAYTQPNGNGKCDFIDGAYHIAESDTKHFLYCATGSILSNFAFQVQMTIVIGDSGGMVFRVDPNDAQSKLYQLLIDLQGNYNLVAYTGKAANQVHLLQGGQIAAFKTGLDHANLITIIAQGNNFYLYVNKQFVTHSIDSAYISGEVGLAAADITSPTDVAFNDAKIWIL
jgi:hypothetical protein